jgi:methylated-DNA-[protein]-cysteine S-methyltransferase
MKRAEECWIGKLEGTPLGPVWLAVTGKGLVAVSLWDDQSRFQSGVKRLTNVEPVWAPARIDDISRQLVAYFNKELEEFDVTIDWSALTPFQELALRAVHNIPYGRLSTYGDIALEIGRPKAVRAVGRANATNPMPIIIPCHRVLGADGKLHGYGAPGGLETKAWLLRLEGSWLI